MFALIFYQISKPLDGKDADASFLQVNAKEEEETRQLLDPSLL